jgi:hypothetical protein
MSSTLRQKLEILLEFNRFNQLIHGLSNSAVIGSDYKVLKSGIFSD